MVCTTITIPDQTPDPLVVTNIQASLSPDSNQIANNLYGVFIETTVTGDGNGTMVIAWGVGIGAYVQNVTVSAGVQGTIGLLPHGTQQICAVIQP